MGDALPYVDLGTQFGGRPPIGGPVKVFDVVAGQVRPLYIIIIIPYIIRGLMN